MHHHWRDLHEYAVAPSPVVPTRRRSRPPSSKRRRYSMPTGPSKHLYTTTPRYEDPLKRLPRPAGASTRPIKNDNVVELIKLFQMSDTALRASQPSGARDILKKRLRLLSQRQKKDADSSSKADDDSRELLALQREGVLSLASGKKSLDSGSSRSTRSKSKKDVEDIGRPWLEQPTKKKEKPDAKDDPLSSLDLGDFASLVEAAVSLSSGFSDVTPPPYQKLAPSALAKEPSRDDQSSKQQPSAQHQLADATAGANQADQPPAKVEPSNGAPSAPDQSTDGDKLAPDAKPAGTTKPQVERNDAENKDIQCPSTPLRATDHQQHSGSKENESNHEPAPAKTQPAPNPVAHPLKLFPDPLPLRLSSKTAWRTSTGNRQPSPNPVQQPPSPKLAPEPMPAGTEPHDERPHDARDAPLGIEDRFPRPHSSISTSAMQSSVVSWNASNPPDGVPDSKSNRRPASLQMGTVNGFPLPAPTKPLPSLPGPATSTATVPEQNAQSAKQGSRSTSGSAAANSRAVRTQSTGSTRLKLDDKQHEPAQQATSKEVDASFLERTRKSRADRVRALRMKDISESRLHVKEPDTPHEEERPQLDESPILPRVLFQEDRPRRRDFEMTDEIEQRYSRNLAPETPPSRSSHSSASFVQQHVQRLNGRSGMRNSSLPSSSVTSLVRLNKPVMDPDTPRSNGTFRSNSTRSASLRYNRSDSPSLPSSDDEALGPGMHASRSRQVPGRRRKSKLPQRSVCVAGSHAGSRTRKPEPSDSTAPLTPPSHRTYFSHESQPGHRAQPRTVPNATHIIHMLEARVADLERQNKALQAALLATLNVNVKRDTESILTAFSATASMSATSFSSLNHSSSADEPAPPNPRRFRKEKVYRPSSWNNSVRNSYASSSRDGGGEVRALEDMIEDLEVGWPSDRSSMEVSRGY